MVSAPIEHSFVIDGERYVLREWTRGGERRMRADYAIAISAAPQTLESLDGVDLWVEAVARECLIEAPALWWETLPVQTTQNGTPRRVVSTEHIPRAVWEAFRREVNHFLETIFPSPAATPEPASAPGAGLPDVVASPQAVPALLRGRAE